MAATEAAEKVIWLQELLGDNVDEDFGKTTTGHIFYLDDSSITWCSQKKEIVALSSHEAEFLAATEAAKKVIWLQELLGEIVGKDARK